MNKNEEFHEIDSIYLEIPFMSISVNEAYSGKERRYKSDKYKEFESNIRKFFLERGETIRITGDEWLGVEYQFFFPLFNKNGTIKKKDVLNFEKVLTDSLSHYIEGFEDSKIKKSIIEKIDSETERIIIKIYEIKK